MMTDPIADMLTRIRNAQAVGKPTVTLPASKLKRALAELLVREGWLERLETTTTDSGVVQSLTLTLRYEHPGMPRIASIRRVSRPGCRVYVTKGDIPRVKRGAGLAVLSTPHGLLTNREARAKGVGGEVLCELY